MSRMRQQRLRLREKDVSTSVVPASAAHVAASTGGRCETKLPPIRLLGSSGYAPEFAAAALSPSRAATAIEANELPHPVGSPAGVGGYQRCGIPRLKEVTIWTHDRTN